MRESFPSAKSLGPKWYRCITMVSEGFLPICPTLVDKYLVFMKIGVTEEVTSFFSKSFRLRTETFDEVKCAEFHNCIGTLLL